MDDVQRSYEAIHDFPRRRGDPALQYLLAASPRSGSTYVAVLLWRSGVLGAPMEYLNFDHIADSVERLGHGDILRYWTELRRCRTSPNGVFGYKMFVRNYAKILSAHPQLLPFITADFVIFLRRRDRIAQAISHYRAAESGSWFSGRAARSSPEYDFEKMMTYYRDLLWQEERWETIFGLRNTEPLRIFYEDAVADPARIVARTCSFLGVQPDRAGELRQIQVPRRQADELSSRWRERFSRELEACGCEGRPA